MSDFTKRHGPVALVLTRPFPILAEVCVLMSGTGRLSWRRFLPPVLVSNLFLALTYSACGVWFRDSPSLPIIIIVASEAVPLVAALVIRR